MDNVERSLARKENLDDSHGNVVSAAEAKVTTRQVDAVAVT